MNVSDAIENRRSVRKYKKDVPSENTIKKILKAGIWAPSGLNNQPWKFKVVTEEKQKKGLAEFTKYSTIINSAPVAICAFLDKDVMYNRDKDVMAVGACIQNMLLEAQVHGVSTCWLGEILNRRKEVEKYLLTAKSCELMAVITLGISDEDQGQGERRPLEAFVM